jgi:hypothetical protein
VVDRRGLPKLPTPATAGAHVGLGESEVSATRILGLVPVALAAIGCLLPVADATAAEPVEYAGRGIYYIEGAVASPVGAIGERSGFANNRLALDDDHTRAVVDRTGHRIVLLNSHRYGLRDLVGCLLLIGRGTTVTGREVPTAVHLKIHKSGNRFSSSLHPHPTVRENLVAATFEPFEVVLDNGVTQKVALTPEQAALAVRDPALSARLANIVMQVTDNLEGTTPSPDRPNETLVDSSLGFGSKRVNLTLARVRLLSKSAKNAAMLRRGAISEMIEKGDWEFLVDSQSPYVPRSEFERDFFLYDLEGLPALAKISKRGLLYGESISVGLDDGVGYITVDGVRSQIRHPAEVARAYLEFHFVGGIVAQQVAQLGERLAAESAE